MLLRMCKRQMRHVFGHMEIYFFKKADVFVLHHFFEFIFRDNLHVHLYLALAVQ